MSAGCGPEQRGDPGDLSDPLAAASMLTDHLKQKMLMCLAAKGFEEQSVFLKEKREPDTGILWTGLRRCCFFHTVILGRNQSVPEAWSKWDFAMPRSTRV